ncbi:hypothetical protein BJP25_07285 [Actinokineospora bangkokensis]|uniref:CU044_5270 family protein n=1 Tax=Actinokineospora bangkokensis TaxID=1193682 RepID=A0A1Q9LTG3_9PSEU|nr:hypothetical protein BJP25_07285 [Actinokineospora bangkokensis]
MPPRPAFERSAPSRGRWLLAGATVTAAVVGLLAYQAAGPTTPQGTAATPAPLVITAPATATPAAQRLTELAQRARTSGVPQPTGTTEYIELRAWYLNSQTSEDNTVSAVVPEIHRTWANPDGSGRAESEQAEPEFRNDADRAEWDGPTTSTDTDSWGPGERPSAFGTGRPPIDPDALAQYLHRPNPPDAIGPVKTLVALQDLLRDRVLTPTERAAALNLLAQLPDITYQGTTTDRTGRTADAFSLDSAYGGLPARYTLLIAPDTGVILGNEEMLTSAAGKLNVTIPAVVEYETYVRAEFQ